MTFPSKEKINELSEALNSQFRKNSYFIWNLSEYTYNTKVFNNQVNFHDNQTLKTELRLWE